MESVRGGECKGWRVRGVESARMESVRGGECEDGECEGWRV